MRLFLGARGQIGEGIRGREERGAFNGQFQIEKAGVSGQVGNGGHGHFPDETRGEGQ